jgi:lipoprotein-releasing system permease protein
MVRLSRRSIFPAWISWTGKRMMASRKRLSFLGLSAWLSILGTGVGVAAIIVVVSVMKGFQIELEKRLMGSSAQIIVRPLPSSDTYRAGTVDLAEILSPPILRDLEATPTLALEVILRSGGKTVGAVVKGVDEFGEKRVRSMLIESALPQMLVDRDTPNANAFPKLWIGKELAYDLSVIPGDFITVINPSVSEGPLGTIPRFRRFVVAGIYSSGVPDQELGVAYTSLSEAEVISKTRGRVSQLEIFVENPQDALAIAARLKRELKGVAEIQSWRDQNAALFFSMKLERFAMFVVLAFAVLIATLNIVSTLSLLVQEKRREIGILRTLGSTDKNISSLFFLQGLRLGVLGVLGGLVLSGVVVFTLQNVSIIALPEIYFDRHLPVAIEWMTFFVTAAVSLMFVLLAAWVPAQRSRRFTPVEALKRHGG